VPRAEPPPAATGHERGPTAPDVVVETPLWRGLAVFRTLTLVYALALYADRWQDHARPVLGWLTLVAMAAWTGWWWWRRAAVTWRLVVADLVVACAAAGMTLLVDTPARIAAGAQTLPVIWPASAVLAWAVWRGWRGGLAAALVLAGVDSLVAGRLSGNTLHNNVLMLLLGVIVGYCADLFRGSHLLMRQALAVQAATAERERLARDIHDSVLQVLAYVQRRGREIGGDGAELGRLAGEQEHRLRTLVAAAPPARTASGSAAVVDLRTALARFDGGRVSVVSPGTPVLMPADDAAELVAAVAAGLDNVERHAGPGASAWLLVEDTGDQVVVTLRDDGAGMAQGRLGEAAAAGRLGVSHSVRGRLLDLGGVLAVHSRPGEGTELTMTVPRRLAR
jgi:signal transduction histidine kinase